MIEKIEEIEKNDLRIVINKVVDNNYDSVYNYYSVDRYVDGKYWDSLEYDPKRSFEFVRDECVMYLNYWDYYSNRKENNDN